MKQVLIALDQLANTLLLGMADETLSARAWRNRNLTLIWFIDRLFFWQNRHCFHAYLAECERRQLPGAYRHCTETDRR